MCIPFKKNSGNHAVLYKLFEANRFHDALQTAVCMDQQRIPMTRDVIYHLLQGCTQKKDLNAATKIHLLMHKNRLDHVACLCDYLIRLYAVCGNLSGAQQVFSNVLKPTGLTWNAIISAHVNSGHSIQALDLYVHMQKAGQKPDRVTFLSILRACSNARCISEGRKIHGQIIIHDVLFDAVLGSTLTDMYAKCGSLVEAHSVFKMVPHRNVVSWDVMICGYAHNGDGVSALQFFDKMQREGIQPDSVTFLGVLKACSCLNTSSCGVLVHDQIVKQGLECDVVIASALVDMYSKCGSIEESRSVFDKMACRNLVSWGAMISGYAHHGPALTALELFVNMELEGLKPDKHIYSGIIKACGIVGDLVQGRSMHERVTRAGFETGEVVGNMLVEMYARCGSMDEAQKIFDKLQIRNPSSWGVLISGYVQIGQGLLALEFYENMKKMHIQPSKITYLSILKACCIVQDKTLTELVHDHVMKSEADQDLQVGSALVDVYAKCGDIQAARQVFNKLSIRNVVTWGAMMSGYAQLGLALQIIELYEKLHCEEIQPNNVIFLCVLKACCNFGLWIVVCMVHNQIIKFKLESDLSLGNTLIDTYAKCGSLQEAENVFEKLPNRDIVSYTAIITAHAESGNCTKVIECAEQMCTQGLKPDDVIYTIVVASCNHFGLVNEGYSFFNRMQIDYGIIPRIEHLTCMVDLLCHAGRLKEADALIQTMHISPDIIMQRSFLTGCRAYGHANLGSTCFGNTISGGRKYV